MIRKDKALYYADYLNLPTLTSLQQTESAKVGNEAHDETLFIVVHQAYELWFKQILFEVDAVRTTLTGLGLVPYIIDFE